MNIVDLHCDTLLKLKDGYSISDNCGHITDKGLKLGGYLAQCFAIYTPPEIRGEDAFLHFKNQYDLFNKTVFKSKILETAFKENSIIDNNQNDKVWAVLTVENLELLNGKIERRCII